MIRAISIRQYNIAPRKVWDFVKVHAAELRSMDSLPNPQFKGITPQKLLSGYTPNIVPFI